MTQPATIHLANPDTRTLREVIRPFQKPLVHVAIGQVASTIAPLIALIAAMHVAMALGWWPLLVLGLPAGAFTVRTFIIQHDCGHASFLPSRSANDWLGRACAVLTLAPYANWRRQHGQHHGTWNNLDRRTAAGLDIYSSCLTVAEYLALSSWRRTFYRTAKHPCVSLLLLPPLIFIGLYRFPFDTPLAWLAERRSVHLTNLSLFTLHGTLAVFLGVGPVLAVLLAVMVPASIVGVWLFSLQHNFDGSVWLRQSEWTPMDAALHGSSFLRLPRLLQWLTGNIGFHHVHHLAPRVPNYRLEDCHQAHPGFAVVPVLTLADGLHVCRHALWDETDNRMVTFSEAAA